MSVRSTTDAIVDNPAVAELTCPSLLPMTFVVGEYRAIELIATGGSAQVWRGVAASTGAPVALKVFPPDRLAMARREAALAAAVDHPHVVRVLDVVGDTERAALITEYAAGGDLADLLGRRGRLTAGETLTVLLPLAAALATAHERQIVHGDLSARNVLFDKAGRPLLSDLGAGRAASEGGRPVAVTPPDAAPELARGATPCAATDMFSLGSLALACLTGRHAWPADDLRDVLIQAAAGQWPDPDDADGPPLLISAIRALLEHDQDRRPGAASLVMDLRAAGRPEPVDLRLPPAPPGRGAGVPEVAGAAGGVPGAAGAGGVPGADAVGAAVPGAWVIGRDRAPGGGPAPTGGRHGRVTDADVPPLSARSDSARRPRSAPRPGSDQRAGSDPRSGRVRSDHSSTAAHEDERLDLGRVGRARAVTRVRPDAVRPPAAAPITRLRRIRSFTGPRSNPSSRSGRRPVIGSRPDRRSHMVRTAVLAAVAVLVAGLAGAGGLWWANWDRTDPVALQQTSAAVATTASAPAASPSRRSASGTTGSPRPAVPEPDAPGTVASSRSTVPSPAATAAPTTSRASTAGTTARPPARPAVPKASLTGAPVEAPGSTPRSAAPQTSSPPDVSSPAGSDPSTAGSKVLDLTATVRALDDARARALVQRDATLLDAVYTSDSTARSADATTIRSLLSGGLHLSGAEHLVRNTKVIGSAPLRVEVADSLPSYSLLDAGGAVVGSTVARAVAARVMVLVKTPAGYRISAVQSA